MSLESVCKSCRAIVVWSVTLAGKRMPLDHAPSPDGRFFVFVPDDPREPLQCANVSERSERAEEARYTDRPRYTSHFATCPNAEEHRRKRMPKAAS